MSIVFLDRDGVISIFVPRDFLKSWEEFAFLPAAFEGLKLLNEAGFSPVVISNQSGVNRGLFTREALDDLTARMLEELKRRGAPLAGVYYCVHRDDENCDCRKPGTGLFRQAERDFGPVDYPSTFFIGDARTDIEAGKKAGLRTILVLSGRTTSPDETADWPVKPDFVAPDLVAAARIVIARTPSLSTRNTDSDSARGQGGG